MFRTAEVDKTAGGPAPRSPGIVELCGLRFRNVDEGQCVREVLAALADGRGGWIVTPNTDITCRCEREPSLAELVSEADVLVADGMPLIWASRLQGTPLPERVCGSNLIWSLSGAAAEAGRSIFLLGGDPGTAEGAAEVLRGRWPRLRVAGTCCPPFGFEQEERGVERIVEALAAARPDIVFVAMGFPKSERLIRRVRTVLPGAWWIGVGISFSFVTGRVRRAPKWMQRLGLEWVHRLMQEPRRLIRRYLIDDTPFAVMLLCRSARRRLRGVGPAARTPNQKG